MTGYVDWHGVGMALSKEATMAADDPSASLEEIRERHAIVAVADLNGSAFGSLLNAALVQLAVKDTSRLLAAIEAVLKLTEPPKERHYDLDGNWEGPVEIVIPAAKVRAAISRELTGKGEDGNHG